MEPPNSPDQFDRVKKALWAGNKIEAIKLYREQTGVGLAEAKAAVEGLEVRGREMAAESVLNSTNQTEAIRAALLAGKKIEAIKLYREQNKVGLAEAKAAVDAMEAQLRGLLPGGSNPLQSKGCFGMVAIGGLLIVALWKVLT